ncbi:MAG TPA: hypothetical protein PKD24_08565 [Pyrinomonadaceae bacterium]|nr:hypothetical protein [Pyrinomonadaceae bacterium]HMP65879.1 hypothetical protein [Pyrinomonadaceae bacterium]
MNRSSRWIGIPLRFGLYLSVCFLLLEILIELRLDLSSLPFTFVLATLGGLLLVYLSSTSARSKAGSERIDDSIYSVRQRRTILLNKDIASAFGSCLYVAQDMNRVKILRSDPGAHLIEVRTRTTWDSFGSIVTFSLEQVGHQLTEVTIESRPYLRTTLVDFGHSWKEIASIANRLRETDVEIGRNSFHEGARILLHAASFPVTPVPEIGSVRSPGLR